MRINEERLRQNIGSTNLIGCYTKNNDGSTCFTDIRGEEGNSVENPLTSEYDLKIEYNGPKLELNTFYSFAWHLKNKDSFIIEIVGSPTKINNKKFLLGLFDARLRLSGSALDQFNKFQDTTFNEVTGAQHTYIYELLQNANDYPYNQEPVTVKFILTKHYLFFMHSGACFNLRNVIGISNINQGEKKENTKTIGYKGIGFKTVFVNNEYVYLKSGDWSLRFDRKYCEEKFFGKCPWALTPILTDVSELDEEAHDIISKYDMRVQFALRHKTDASKNIEQLDKIFCDNQILLFIPHVYKVEVIVENKVRHLVEKDATKWVVSDYTYKVPTDLKEWVKENINSGNKIPEKFKDLDNVQISFAVGRDGKHIIPIENARVYNYLPTELKLGFCFLFNADFVPNGSRSGLHDVTWNDRIMEQCGCQFADWWVSFLQEENNYDMNSVFDILPQLDSQDKYAQLFLNSFKKRIVEIPCIPTLREGYYHLVKLENVLYDKIEFIVCEKPILTDEELYKFSDTTGCLPHPAVRCNENLIRLLKNFDCTIPFSDNDLSQLCFETDFLDWLTKDNHDYQFIGYLLESGYIMNYWDYKIFLTEDGQLDKADRIYYDIDNFIDDISFLSSDLPRLNVTLRNLLSINYNTWESNKGRFIKFNGYTFVKNIFDNFSKYENLFSVKENNIHFIHFLSVTDYIVVAPQNYPFFIEDDTWVSTSQDVYQRNEVASELSSHSWIEKDWLKFIHKDYFARDEEKVSNFLSSKYGIKPLTESDCYRLFIANDNRVAAIASMIKEKSASIDFYHYLSRIQDVINNMTSVMRQNYCILTTDGKTVSWSPITKTIFWQDNEWIQMSNTVWMPNGCCLAIYNCYFEGLSEEEDTQLRTLLSTKQVVQKFSISGLYQSLRPQLDDVFAIIKTKEISKDFLDFLFKHQTEIFKNGQIDSVFKRTPILCKDCEELYAIENYGEDVYIPNSDALDLYNQPWFNRTTITLCDDYYADLFDGSERCSFFENLGLKIFRKTDYLRTYLLVHLEQIEDNLVNRGNNISFHRYISDVHGKLSDEDLKKVKEMPIYISSPNEKSGVLAKSSDNHYLPSDLLTDIISKDLVPITILDSIHPDYIVSEDDKRYFVEKLGNTEIDENGFYNYIVKGSIVPKVTSYLKDVNRNVRFWRWVCDSKESRENKAKLNILPMLFRYNESTADGYDVPPQLFISDSYSGVNGLEAFICKNVDSPKFISSAYKEEGVERDWIALFKTLKVTIDYKDIVFKNVLPNLAKYKDTKIVSILAKYVDTIKHKLSDEDEKTKEYLNKLYLKCNDGEYRMTKDVVVSGKFYDIDINPFPDIEINNLVSEEYINCIEDDTQKRNVIKLIVSIADNYDVKAKNVTQLRNLKLKYFAKHQDYYAHSETHYRIIGELANAYNTDVVGISDIIQDLGTIKLYTTTGKFINSSSLYLSTVYKPDCQYMANGITELDFVSEKYDEYYPNGLKRMFVSCFNVHESFSFSNLEQLQNERFAYYFWGNYAKDKERLLKEIVTEENLRNIACIPTIHGIKKPMEVYDYRNSQLQKIVLKLQDGKEKLPSVEIPNWVENIGLRKRLYVLDCLEYMNLDTHDYRREVIKWFVETKDETLQRHKNAIDRYRESANWFNGAKNWVSLSTLVALEWGNKTLKGNFGGNAYVCNSSYMPESKDDYVKLCKILNIKILSNDDFIKHKSGVCKKDTVAIEEISKRLLYLAYRTNKGDWENIYAGYKEKLDNSDISQCERIIYSYDEHIFTNLRIYSEEATVLWYVGSWTGPMFIKVLDWIIKNIVGKDKFDEDFLNELFLCDFVYFIKQQEGGSLPATLLAHLDEAERESINIDDSVNAEEFTEDVDNVNKLPEDVMQQASSGMGQRLNQLNEQSEEIGKEDYSDNSYIRPVNDGQPTTERKQRSDLGGTHQRHEPALDEPHPISSYSDTSDRENSQPIGRKSFTDRLKEKWNKQKNAPVQKPHSARRTENVDIFNSTNSSSYTENKEDFFDEDINTTQDTYNTSDRNTLSDHSSQENFNNKQKTAQEELDKAMDQVDLSDALIRTKKYTFLWFKYLMEQLYNQKNETTATKSVQIDFKETKVLNDNTIVILRPNRVVPKWIEYADKTTLYILKGDVSEQIEVKLQYFTEDAIWVLYENASELVTKTNEADKVRLFANGNYTNHIDSLTKRFIKLDLPDDYNLRDNLPDCIKYIYGPPGTGKTTRLVGKIQDIIQNNKTNLDILVLTPTNKAADVIASRLSDNDVCAQYTYRFGVTESLKFLETNNVYTRNDEFINNNGRHIIITTAARYAYDYFMPSEEIVCDHHWDYIIIDEASMMDIVTMAFILFKSKNCQFVISGDPKQIQPVRQNEVQPENIYQMVGLSSFAAAQTNPKVECLNTQYRSIPTIGNLVSKFSYNGIVKPNRPQCSQKPLNLGFKISSINYVGFKTENFDNLYGLDAIDGSAFHLYSAIFCYEYASYITRKIKESNPSDP